MDSEHVVLSALQPETVSNRIIDKEDKDSDRDYDARDREEMEEEE